MSIDVTNIKKITLIESLKKLDNKTKILTKSVKGKFEINWAVDQL